ncbi:hypothetical protein PWG15_23710 (plasmid) [Ensifer adhaerens]|uniref:hypothetical protein n=1 Tax=Ensifer adhaerens TaxID=106592 RepID=UPI0023A95CAE|nr:hypothetical protein [Ensifer adhaerens]WDZ80771.1 hypothetical protein PWG15_23710 [Ensifer adhaerens]
MTVLSRVEDIALDTEGEAVSQRRARRFDLALAVILSASVLLWALSLPAIDPDRMTDIGLISVLPRSFFLSLALLAAGFAWLVCGGRTTGPLPILYLVALVILLHGTPPIVYGTLRYSWAWKHLGVIDYIQRYDAVDRNASFLAAYHNWPGLFAATAWLADRFDLRSVDLAPIVSFTPPVLTLALIGAFLGIVKRLSADRRLQLTACWIFVVANWVGQEYFSPQGVTFLCYLILIGLFLGPLRKRETTWAARRPGFLRFIGPEALPAGLPSWTGGRFARPLAALLAMTLISVVVVTHQLTPLMIILATAGLAVLGWLSPAYLLFAIIAEIVWLLWPAAPFVYEQILSELASMGTLSEATSKLANVADVSADRAWVVLLGRGLSAAVIVGALLGGSRRILNGHWDLTAAALLLSPMPLIAVAYGGESIFRVYLFASPFLAFFAATAFFPSVHAGKPAYVFTPLAAAFFLSAIGFLFANNGKDREYRFAPDEVAVAEWLYSIAPEDTLLIEGSRSYPSQFMNYENFYYLAISLESEATRAEIVANSSGVFLRWMDNPRWRDAYVILTRSQKASLEANGQMRPGDFDRIEHNLLVSPRFKLVRASANAKVFRMLPATSDGSALGNRYH